MGALVVLPPILPDAVGFTRSPVDEYVNGGSTGVPALYVLGSAIYLVGVTGINSLSGPEGRIFKSTDAGLTWTRQDAAGEPLNPISGFTEKYDTSFFDGAQFIYVSYRTAAGKPALVLFDCLTDTYGTPTEDPSLFAVPGVAGWVELVQADGTVFIFLCDAINIGRGLGYNKVTAGVWAACTEIASGVTQGWLITGALDPATGDMHLFFVKWAAFAVTRDLFYMVLSAAEVPGTPVNLLTFADTELLNSGLAAVWEDCIVLPYIDPVGGIVPKVLIGTPLSAPVWTTELVDSGLVALQATGYDCILSIDSDGNLVFDWIVDDAGSGDSQIWRNTRTLLGWGTPELVYDKVANETPVFTDPLIHSLAAVELPAGNWAWDVAMDVPTHVGLCAGWILLSEAPTTPPVPSCPIAPGGQGQVGVPFSAQIGVTGGTAPYTFTLVAGSLPPGLTLDSATGIISGTPTTSGTYAYTIKVTGS